MVSAGDQSVALACPAMGTRFEIILRGADAVSLRSAGEAAVEEVQRWHALLSAFDSSSIVSRINREAAMRAVPVPAEVAALLKWCGAVSAATGGAFDPAVGSLMRSAGFRGEPRGDESPIREPMRSVLVEEHGGAWRVRLATPGIALDFGAIGKGWALDRAAEVLRESDVSNAILHGGTSSIVTIGSDGDAPWRVAMGEGGDVIELVDQAVGLSMPTGRVVRDRNGTEHGHIIDPRTSDSVSAVALAAVIGPSAAVCDAWSTALVVDPSLANSASWPGGYRAVVNLNKSGGGAAACSTQACRSDVSELGIEQGSVR